MSSKDRAPRSVGVPVSSIGVRHRPRLQFAVIGNPNSGKSTLFNRLTGLRQSTGNYPGVTVEKHTGTLEIDGAAYELVDLPGIYSLGGDSADERIAIDVLLGRIDRQPDGLLVVLDATRLYQGLYLVEQLIDLQLPMVIALTMSDMAKAGGISLDTELLGRHLGGIEIIEVAATSGIGVLDLKQALPRLADAPVPAIGQSWPELSLGARQLAEQAPSLSRMDVILALLHGRAALQAPAAADLDEGERAALASRLFGSELPEAVEARRRYAWSRRVVAEVQSEAPLLERFGARLLHWVNRPWPATVMFFASLVLVFQAVFSWATPLMDAIDQGAAALGIAVGNQLGEGLVASFIADGVIAGVGSVVVFLPQILILFLFIIVLEDTGYLARAAFLMDRAMRKVGLSGQSVIPMLSSFACAVPSIMATRVIPDRRDRIATIMAAPFMTCSARLPIYALLIAAFVPHQSVGWFNLQGLVLFGLYIMGILGGLLTARLMKSTALRGPKPPFMLALPDFRRPNLQTVAFKLLDRARIFLKRAGTVIFAVAVVVWALASFPRSPVEPSVSGGEYQQAAMQMEQSYLGRIGRVVEPLFEPLGWDWKVSSAVIAGFPAREVVVAVMGTLYAVGAEADEQSLSDKLRSARWPDGAPIFTLPMVLGLMVFYAWCLQCAATVAVIRRETNSWRWPLFAWGWMTGVAYLGALAVFQLGTRLF